MLPVAVIACGFAVVPWATTLPPYPAEWGVQGPLRFRMVPDLSVIDDDAYFLELRIKHYEGLLEKNHDTPRFGAETQELIQKEIDRLMDRKRRQPAPPPDPKLFG